VTTKKVLKFKVGHNQPYQLTARDKKAKETFCMTAADIQEEQFLQHSVTLEKCKYDYNVHLITSTVVEQAFAFDYKTGEIKHAKYRNLCVTTRNRKWPDGPGTPRVEFLVMAPCGSSLKDD
jgi:hypothetical protein